MRPRGGSTSISRLPRCRSIGAGRKAHGQRRPKALLLERPRGLLTPVNEAVLAPALLTPLTQCGPGRGAKICRLGREDITWCVAYSLFLKPRENCDYSVRLLRDNMQCPVCDGSARDHTPPEFDGIVVGCATCGNYDIANKYLDKLRVLAPEVRREVLRKAKQFAKFARPSIDKRCF